MHKTYRIYLTIHNRVTNRFHQHRTSASYDSITEAADALRRLALDLCKDYGRPLCSTQWRNGAYIFTICTDRVTVTASTCTVFTAIL